MELEILAKQNPWWKDKAEIENDEDIRKWKDGKRKWMPSEINEISLKPFLPQLHFRPKTSR